MKDSILFFISIALICVSCNLFSQSTKYNPSFEEVLSLQSVRNVKISPSGDHLAFEVSYPDWRENTYKREVWISKNGKDPFQLTNTPKGSSRSPAWSPNGEWIAFLSDRKEKTQIYVIRSDGGEAFPLTQGKESIQSFEWSPDGTKLAFRRQNEETESDKLQEERFGKFVVEDSVFRYSSLYILPFYVEELFRVDLPCDEKDSTKNSCVKYLEAQKLIDSVDFTVSNFKWSPDSKKIAFSHQPNPLINSFFYSNISIVDVESKEKTTIVNNPSVDRLICWSPDAEHLLYSSAVDDFGSVYYENNRYFITSLSDSETSEVAVDFDENLYGLTWNKAGIFGTGYQKTKRHLFKMNPESGYVETFLSSPERIWSFSFSADAETIAIAGENNHDLADIYLHQISNNYTQKISDFSSQIAGWRVADSEVILWNSKDGTKIEGVLYKPQDYDPFKKYPLLVIIHGGPTGISLPRPTASYVYPIVNWVNKGALVMSPNYRGSAGYGEKFRSLNVKNLGVGDAWDVMSGVDYLADMGLIDTSKMGAMGWSQGGYISAFLTTTTNSFKAISVGAGISNWMTYYVNTDIHPFTRQYLKETPWSGPEVYAKTSPISYINNASTPTLIQHGEFDRRVPIPNAYELYQGLQDVGVKSKLIVYKGFGHGINKPKERLAAVWHNWEWFGKYIWGEVVQWPTK